MFEITIRDHKGKEVFHALAERYMLLGQQGNAFTTTYSSPDLVEKLGLLAFATNLVKDEQSNASSPTSALQSPSGK